MACQGQLRVAPSGHVLAIDLGVALGVATARGYDVAAVSSSILAL